MFPKNKSQNYGSQKIKKGLENYIFSKKKKRASSESKLLYVVFQGSFIHDLLKSI